MFFFFRLCFFWGRIPRARSQRSWGRRYRVTGFAMETMFRLSKFHRKRAGGHFSCFPRNGSWWGLAERDVYHSKRRTSFRMVRNAWTGCQCYKSAHLARSPFLSSSSSVHSFGILVISHHRGVNKHCPARKTLAPDKLNLLDSLGLSYFYQDEILEWACTCSSDTLEQ